MEDKVKEEAFVAQRNTLPIDTMRQGRTTNDVLWNGPRPDSKVQKVGALVIGTSLIAMAMVMASIFEVRDGGWLACIPTAVLGAFGARICYRAFRSKKKLKVRKNWD